MANSVASKAGPEKFWVPGDWNAFFGFGTNILVNVLVLTGLLRFVLKMPDELVFGRILPATGLMLFLSTVYYAWLAYRLAKKTGRTDVCALPSGISVPHMFVVTFVVMLPILGKTNDPVQAWEAGLTWVFVQSFVLMVGGFIAPVIRRITPRAALLGSLAGISITFISMRPGLLIFETPLIGLVCFAVILANWFGGVRYYQGVPGGLIAIAAGTIIAWGSNIFGLGYGGLTLGAVGDAVSHFGFSIPLPAVGHVFSGFKWLGDHPGDRDSVRHLRPCRSDGQCRERRGGRRLVSNHAGADRRRRRQPDRLPSRQPVHQRCLYRPSGLEGDGRAHRLFRRDRRDGAGADVAWHRRARQQLDPGGRDPADPALYRHADRLSGLPGDAEESCAGDHSGHAAADRRLGQNHDRRRARRRGHQRRRRRLRQARQCRHPLSWALRRLAAGRRSPASSWAR